MKTNPLTFYMFWRRLCSHSIIYFPKDDNIGKIYLCCMCKNKPSYIAAQMPCNRSWLVKLLVHPKWLLIPGKRSPYL